MIQCPNCKRLLLPEVRVCPHCGEVIPPMPSLQGDKVVQIARRPPLRGAKDWTMAILGFLVAFLSPFFFGIGFLVAIAIYFGAGREKTPFIRGLGVGLVTFAVLLLGAFVLCLLMMVGIGH